MVQYLHFWILEFQLISRNCLFYLLGVAICTCHRFEPQVLNRQKAEFSSRIAPWNFKGCHVPGKTLEMSWDVLIIIAWNFHQFFHVNHYTNHHHHYHHNNNFQTPIYFYIHVLFVCFFSFIDSLVRSFIHSFILFFHSFMHF